MPELRLICEKILQEVNGLLDKSTLKDWADMHPNAFVYNLKVVIGKFEEISADLARIDSMQGARHSVNVPNVEELIKEYSKEITAFQAELKKEQERIKKIHGGELPEELLRPAAELYGHLEERTLRLLTRTGHLVERVEIYDRRQKGDITTTRLSLGNAMEVIDKKNQEINELKSEVKALQEAVHFGGSGKKDVYALENIANEFLKEAAKDKKSKQMAELTKELIEALKKERDFAYKSALRLEHEIAKMKHEHAKGMLRIEEAKREAGEGAKRKLEKEVAKLKKDLADTERVIQHLKHVIYEKDQLIEQLKGRHTHFAHTIVRQHSLGLKDRGQ